MTNPTMPSTKQNRRESALLGMNGRLAMGCRLTFALWRVGEGAKRRAANVAHQRAVRCHCSRLQLLKTEKQRTL